MLKQRIRNVWSPDYVFSLTENYSEAFYLQTNQWAEIPYQLHELIFNGLELYKKC